MSEGRTQWVFVLPCGCPEAVLEGDAAESKSQALREVYDRGQKYIDAALDRGIDVIHIPHAEYVAKFYEKMRAGCTHREG